MVEVIKSDTFDRWLRKLRDPQAKARIEMRIRRLSLGNEGDVKPIGEGLSEMRIDYGPGVSRVLQAARQCFAHLALWRR